MIDNIQLLIEEMFSSCFISYSSKDDVFAKRLYQSLQSEGVRCWFAPHDMKGGLKSVDQIKDAIYKHEKLLLILSKDSLHSNWVATEIKNARAQERLKGSNIFFPISIIPYDEIKNWELFDSDSGMDLAVELRAYHILDFSKWMDKGDYEEMFARLLKDLSRTNLGG